MGYCKLQLGCMLIILYIMFTNYKECSRIRQKFKLTLFDGLLILGMVCVFFRRIDGIYRQLSGRSESESQSNLPFIFSDMYRFVYFPAVFVYVVHNIRIS